MKTKQRAELHDYNGFFVRLVGNDAFEGFGVDLVHGISDFLSNIDKLKVPLRSRSGQGHGQGQISIRVNVDVQFRSRLRSKFRVAVINLKLKQGRVSRIGGRHEANLKPENKEYQH